MKNRSIRILPKTIDKLNLWKADIHSDTYRAYLTIRDVNQVGRRHWMFCPHQSREAHLLSDGERRAYTALLWLPDREHVYEQFALDIDETMDIANKAEIIHPRNYKTGQAHVMTTDFVVSFKNKNEAFTVVFTFKYWSQIYAYDEQGKKKKINHRTWEKFEIERQYWAQRGIEYRVITEQDCTKEMYWNLKFFERSAYIKVDPNLFSQFVPLFYSIWETKCNLRLEQICQLAAQQLNFSVELAIQYFQYGALYQYIRVRHTECVRTFRRLELLPFTAKEVS